MNGVPHGHGTRTYADFSVYTGTFENGAVPSPANPTKTTQAEMHCMHASRWLSARKRSQHLQAGPIASGLRHGQGRLVYSNGDVFEAVTRRAIRYQRTHTAVACVVLFECDCVWHAGHIPA